MDTGYKSINTNQCIELLLPSTAVEKRGKDWGGREEERGRGGREGGERGERRRVEGREEEKWATFMSYGGLWPRRQLLYLFTGIIVFVSF